MKIDLASYLAKREALRKLCFDATDAIRPLDTALVIRKARITGHDILSEVGTKLSERVFRVLVAGEFNAGKSFFINTMLDRWELTIDPSSKKQTWNGLLGVDIVPATTLLTELRYRELESAEIVLRSGDRVPLAVRDVPAFTDLARFGRGSTAHMMHSHVFQSLAERLGASLENIAAAGSKASSEISQWLYETVERAIVYIDSKFLQDGIVLVDSPGLGAVYHEHEAITEAEMRRSDAIVFLIDSTNPLTDRAVTFLLASRTFVDNFFFVQTKIDRFDRTPHDIERVKSHNLAQLCKVMHCEAAKLRYHLVSARRYRSGVSGDNASVKASGFPDLAEAIGSFLSSSRGAQALATESSVVKRILVQAGEQCREAIALAHASAVELDSQLDAVRDEIARVNNLSRQALNFVEEGRCKGHDGLDARRNLLRDKLTAETNRLDGTGGFGFLLGQSPDSQLKYRLTIAASDFILDTFVRDVDALSRATCARVNSLSAEYRVSMTSPTVIRSKLLEADIATSFLQKVTKEHLEAYRQQTEQYARMIEQALHEQIDGHFDRLTQRLSDAFDTIGSVLSRREEKLVLGRQTKNELLRDEREDLKKRAERIDALQNALDELQFAVADVNYDSAGAA
jgi:signal recognition particle receptor subunit beta